MMPKRLTLKHKEQHSQNMESSRLILASASPRRRELLAQAGFSFEIIPARGKEVIQDEGSPLTPDRIVEQLARHKAQEIYDQEKSEESLTVIGADTIVALDGAILGKPRDREDAKRMIRLLQGRAHEVYTGVCILHKPAGARIEAEQLVFSERTQVHVYPMTEEEIDRYVQSGEADDKAGAYGIQTSFGVYVIGITGDYNNVVGLPIARLYQEMKKMPG